MFDPDLTNHLDITQIKVCCCCWRCFCSLDFQIAVGVLLSLALLWLP